MRSGRGAISSGPWVAVALLACALVWPAHADAEPAACGRTPAVVTGATDAERDAVCDGARRAFEFLAPLGAAAGQSVVIELVEALPAGLPADAVGCFSVVSQRVIVLRFTALAARRTVMGVPVDRPLFRSIVTHEVAHAVVRCHLGQRRLPVLAHEYIAYVTMFATMDPALRERVLAGMPGAGYDDEGQINILHFLFDPALFGADSYRHWMRQADGAGFLRRVLDGSVIKEVDRD